MAYTVDLTLRSDERGALYVCDESLPFRAARYYFIRGVPPGIERGFHRHKVTRQLLIANVGSCRVHVHNGREAMDYRLDDPGRGLLLEPADWHYMADFTGDCVLSVLASHPYDAADYIREGYS